MHEYLAPERERIALITIDAQRDFILPGAPASVSGAISTVPAMRRMIDAFREAGDHAARIGHLVDGAGEAKVVYRGALKL